jgi:hypothetical protein
MNNAINDLLTVLQSCQELSLEHKFQLSNVLKRLIVRQIQHDKAVSQELNDTTAFYINIQVVGGAHQIKRFEVPTDHLVGAQAEINLLGY